MLKNFVFYLGVLLFSVGVFAVTACLSSNEQVHNSTPTPVYTEEYFHKNSAIAAYNGGNGYSSPVPLPVRTEMEPVELLKEVRLYKDFIQKGTHARKIYRSMDPRYITIHSTQNFSTGADAWRHSLALKNGKLRAYKRRGGNRIGYLAWHYTIDQNVTVQHIPDNEQGEHADFDGPGNNYSLGLEMCEHTGNSRSLTVERTAKLAAYLMHKHSIPLSNIRAHYHWERKGLSKPHKNCPHFLMDNGVPGVKWRGFLAKIKFYHDKISIPRVASPVYSPQVSTSGPSGHTNKYIGTSY